MSDILIPRARHEVVLALMELSDSRGHTEAWFFNGEAGKVGIDYVVHILFDDYGQFPRPERALGSVFFAGDEIDTLKDLARVLDQVLDDYTFPDLRRVRLDPRWPSVLTQATSALVAMLKNGETSASGQHV